MCTNCDDGYYRDGLEYMLELCKDAIKSKVLNFKIHYIEIGYMRCNFNR